MEFKTKQDLQRLKKMAISYLTICQQVEIEAAKFPGLRSLFFESENEEIERIIKQIDNELITGQSNDKERF